MLTNWLIAADGYQNSGVPGGPFVGSRSYIANPESNFFFTSIANSATMLVAIEVSNDFAGANVAYTTNTSNTWQFAHANGISYDGSTYPEIAYGNDVFVAMAYTSPSVNPAVIVSTDAINWSNATLPTLAAGFTSRLSFAHDRFFGTNGADYATLSDQFLSSPDGVTWTVGTLPIPVYYASHVAYGNGVYAFTASVANGIGYVGASFSSNDGDAWSVNYNGADGSYPFLTSIIYANNAFYGTGIPQLNFALPARIFTSADGIHWSQCVTPPGIVPNGNILYNGEYFVVGSGTQVVYSRDGSNWTYQYITNGNCQDAGAVLGTEFVYPNSRFYPPAITEFATVLTYDPPPIPPPPPVLGNRLLLNDLTVDVPGIVVSPPSVRLRWSDTKGETWNNPLVQTLGVGGDYDVDVSWRQLGISRDRVNEVSWTEPAPIILTGCFIVATICKT